jgi:hypothetical protein
MNENRTASILQRLSVILAVTAASYGLTLPSQGNARQPAVKAPQHAQAAHQR